LPVILQLNEELATNSKSQVTSVHTPIQISPNRTQGEDAPDCLHVLREEELNTSSDGVDSESPVKQVVRSVACVNAADEIEPDGSQNGGPVILKPHESLPRRSSAPSSRISKKLHLSLHGRSSVAGDFRVCSENVRREAVEKLPLKVTKSDASSDHAVEQPVTFELQSPGILTPSSMLGGQDFLDVGCPMTAPALISQKGDTMGLMLKMNRKIRNYLRLSARPGIETDSRLPDVASRSVERAKAREVRFLDLTSDDIMASP